MRFWSTCVLVVVVAGCGSPKSTQTAPLGELIGRIEIDQDVPQPGCKVYVDGTPREATCDDAGQFDLRGIEPGHVTLRVVANEADSAIPARTVATAANPGFITDLGAVRIAKPGSIGGHVIAPPGVTVPFSVISVPGFSAATSPDPSNLGYVLDHVPPGVHEVVLTTDTGAVIHEPVTVFSADITLNVNFDLSQAEQTTVNVQGTAQIQGQTDQHGITVDLVEVVQGQVVSTITTGADGSFSLPTKAGTFLVRAHAPGHMAAATIPSVLVYGSRDILLTSTLVIPTDPDLDGDGIPDSMDPDIDGDGTPNADDAFPYDPSEAKDTDGDGVGDNEDLDSNGDGHVDHAVSTPDTDGDGLLDFEDNCPMVVNADQADSDGDRVGDKCDNCPGVPNHDQADADHNGVGDACEPCIAGTQCTPANACDIGLTSCTSNGAICNDTQQPAPDGQACGNGLVCLAGACHACTNGDTCFTSPGGPCVQGVVSCSSGQGQCLQTATLVANGTPCGSGLVCDNGSCVACSSGGNCPLGGGSCHVGSLSCATGTSTCVDSGVNAADGSSCGGSNVCLAGVCGPCNMSGSCQPQPCRAGNWDCSQTGTAVCTPTGGNVPDGTGCGTGKYCTAGSCVASPNTLATVSGYPQTGNVNGYLSPTVVVLKDGANQPIAGKQITVVPPPGGIVAVAPGATDASGQASFTLRLGPTAGSQMFEVQSPVSAPLDLTFTANASPPGSTYSVIDVDHVNQTSGIPGAAVNAHIRNPVGLAVASDGTLYVAAQTDQIIYKVDPAGMISVLAGTGVAGSTGDGGPATQGTLYYPHGLALDPTGRYLMVSEQQAGHVRRIDLQTGILTTFAGGGSATGPGFGDGATATAATLSLPESLAFDPSGNLYIADTGHTRIRMVTPGGTILPVVGVGDCLSDIALSNCSSTACGLAVDSGGRLFIGAQICGNLPGSSTPGVIRRDPDGSLHHIAGNATGTTGTGTTADNTLFSTIQALAFDAAGNLVIADRANNRVRMVDGVTGIVSPVAGTGTSGEAAEYATAATSPLATPDGIAFDHGDLYIAEYPNGTVRRVTGVAASTSTLAITVPTPTVSTPIDQLVPALTAHVPVSGIRIAWSGVETNEAVLASYSRTNPSGDATVAMRPGVVPGAYHVLATVQTIHGANISGSPATFTVTATAPSAGTIFTSVNVAHTNAGVGQGIPGPAMMARINNVRGIVTASDGTVYFSDSSSRIRKLTTAGMLSDVAGNGTSSPLGDNGPALSAGLNAPSGIALDDVNHFLYIAEQSNNRVRVVDLVGGTIWTFAGDGTSGSLAPYGDGQSATSAQFASPSRLTLFNGGLYIVDGGHTRIRRVELQSPNVVSTVYIASTATCATSPSLVMAGCNAPACETFTIGSTLYLAASFCGGAMGVNTAIGIARVNADTSLTLIAGAYSGSTADGVAPTAASFPTLVDVAVSSTGDIYYIESQRVRKIAGGVITTVTGNGTSGFGGDYGPATAALISNAGALGMAAGDHVLIGDGGNACVREVW
ncbi:MAG: thrombospondin type 3 repeat-containing protein [Deltaproteobacteria bacterium]|nr:thrombospondin type 3 repeat-containing protein [Deltaproteobacteria bacterium]